MTALGEFLYPAPARRSAVGILGWWERRRLGYNLFVGGAGLVTLAVAAFFTSLPFFPGDPEFIPLEGILVFGLGANICYTLGAPLEYLAHRLLGRGLLPVGPTLYRMGLTFSVGLALFPSLIFTVVAILSLLGLAT